jgi:hypothetical protein
VLTQLAEVAAQQQTFRLGPAVLPDGSKRSIVAPWSARSGQKPQLGRAKRFGLETPHAPAQFHAIRPRTCATPEWRLEAAPNNQFCWTRLGINESGYVHFRFD